jgi:hypothetical protein
MGGDSLLLSPPTFLVLFLAPILPMFPHLHHEVHIFIDCRTRHTLRWESARRDVYTQRKFLGRFIFLRVYLPFEPDQSCSLVFEPLHKYNMGFIGNGGRCTVSLTPFPIAYHPLKPVPIPMLIPNHSTSIDTMNLHHSSHFWPGSSFYSISHGYLTHTTLLSESRLKFLHAARHR